jgi:tubulin--tyrosine ligase
MDNNDDLTLSLDTLAALREVMGSSGPAQIAGEVDGDDVELDMESYLMQLRAARGVQDDSSSDEDDDNESANGGEPVDYAAYYTKLRGEQQSDAVSGVQSNDSLRDLPRVAWVSVTDAYTKECVLNSFAKRPHWKVCEDRPRMSSEEADEHSTNAQAAPALTYSFHWGEYEDVEWDLVEGDKRGCVVSAFYNRRGLIRKAILARTIHKWAAKYPESKLARSTPVTHVLEPNDIDTPASILATVPPLDWNSWWILKPSFTNQADGIELVRSQAELVAALEKASELHRAAGFVLQHYIERPLLLLANARKFHLRVYVLAVDDLSVHVFPHMLALFASNAYDASDNSDKYAHLTNTCLQQKKEGCANGDSTGQEYEQEEDSQVVHLWGELGQALVDCGCAAGLDEAATRIAGVYEDVKAVIAETFEAARRELTFQPKHNAFELFGFDVMVDADFKVWLLEANAEPDLKQTGTRLQFVIQDLVDDVVRLTVDENPNFAAHDNVPSSAPSSTTTTTTDSSLNGPGSAKEGQVSAAPRAQFELVYESKRPM